MNVPARNRTVADLIDEYDEKVANVPTGLLVIRIKAERMAA